MIAAVAWAYGLITLMVYVLVRMVDADERSRLHDLWSSMWIALLLTALLMCQRAAA